MTCPSGYTKTTSGGYPTCVTTWGDGYRVGSETCDDGNTTPNDGCSASCAVESGYTWSGGSGTFKDTWSKTSTSASSTSTTSTTTTSPVYTLTSTNRWMALSVWIAFWIWFVLDLIIWWVTEKYPSGLYIWLEHIQLITILPLAGSYFTAEVNGFFRLMRFSLLGFDFINFKEVFDIHLDYGQDNAVLSFLGFGSSSNLALLNIASYLMIGLLIILIEFSFFKLYKLKYQHSLYIEGNDHGRLLNVLSKLKNWILFGGITRFLLLGFVLIDTASIDEINNYSMISYRWSWWISLSLLLWIIIFVSFVFFVISIIQVQSLVESNLYNELINGIKLNKAAKFYTFVFLFHRILIIMFFMVDTGLSSNYKIISVLWVQSVYLLFLLIVRPYDSFKANLTKIIWELSVLILCSLMLSYSTSSSWLSSTGDVFLYIMTVSCCLPIMIVSGNIFK